MFTILTCPLSWALTSFGNTFELKKRLRVCCVKFMQFGIGLLLIVYSYKFIWSILFHFTLILLKLGHAFITTDLLNQNPTKKVMSLHKNCFN